MKTDRANRPRPPKRKVVKDWTLPLHCLSCNASNSYEEQLVSSQQEIKGELLSFESPKWVCRKCGASMLSPEQTDAMLKNAVQEYQRSHGLLTAGGLKEKRAARGWTVAQLSADADVGVATIKRIEAGATAQRSTTDKALRKALDEEGWVTSGSMVVVTKIVYALRKQTREQWPHWGEESEWVGQSADPADWWKEDSSPPRLQTAGQSEQRTFAT